MPITADYNLLRPLRTLLEERNVTRAAERMLMSQSSMSIALARLRTHFDDPLLIRTGNRHVLTPLAERLLLALPEAIAQADLVFGLQSRFDPATSTRTFVIAGVDYPIARIAPALSRILAHEAPTVRLELPELHTRLLARLPEALRTIDGVILPHGYLAEQPHLDLATESWACLVDADFPDGDLLDRPWVHNVAARERMSPALQQLTLRGAGVRIAAVTPHFFVLPSLLLGTDRVAIVPEGFARMAVRLHPRLRQVAPPAGLEPLHDAFWWHPDHEHDSGHGWLRGVLERARDGVIADSNDGHSDHGLSR